MAKIYGTGAEDFNVNNGVIGQKGTTSQIAQHYPFKGNWNNQYSGPPTSDPASFSEGSLLVETTTKARTKLDTTGNVFALINDPSANKPYININSNLYSGCVNGPAFSWFFRPMGSTYDGSTQSALAKFNYGGTDYRFSLMSATQGFLNSSFTGTTGRYTFVEGGDVMPITSVSVDDVWYKVGFSVNTLTGIITLEFNGTKRTYDTGTTGSTVSSIFIGCSPNATTASGVAGYIDDLVITDFATRTQDPNDKFVGISVPVDFVPLQKLAGNSTLTTGINHSGGAADAYTALTDGDDNTTVLTNSDGDTIGADFNKKYDGTPVSTSVSLFGSSIDTSKYHGEDVFGFNIFTKNLSTTSASLHGKIIDTSDSVSIFKTFNAPFNSESRQLNFYEKDATGLGWYFDNLKDVRAIVEQVGD